MPDQGPNKTIMDDPRGARPGSPSATETLVDGAFSTMRTLSSETLQTRRDLVRRNRARRMPLPPPPKHTGPVSKLLPRPPDDEEKYSYVVRRMWLLNLFSLISFAGLTVSQVKFTQSSALALIFVPFLIFTVLYYLVSLRINLFTRDFDLEGHKRLVESWRPRRYPSVDIFLPVCGEPLDVLHNTWTHVRELAIRYPGKVVPYVLDDSDSAEIRELARDFQFRYEVRPNRGWFKKAGNMQYGFRRSSGDFILILDADFAPRSDMLEELIPHMDADPKLGIVQSPQYFRVLDEQNWIERGAGAVQELFYRSVQVSRQSVDGSICVGTCALYRRAALAENGGTTLIGHSEDVHTGFDLRKLGWGLKYVPVALSAGQCPDSTGAFFNQQYRWCMGSMSLLSSKKFWSTKMRFVSRLSYCSGFLYYIHTAVFVFVSPLIPLTLLLFLPELVRIENLVWILPSLVYTMLIFPLWHRSPFRLESWSIRLMYSWAHVFAIYDLLRGRPMGWQPTGSGGAKKSKHRRFWIGVWGWGMGTSLLWVGAAFWRTLTLYPPDFTLVLVSGMFSLVIVARILIQPKPPAEDGTPAIMDGRRRYAIPRTPAMGWLAHTGGRRLWLGRIMLSAVLFGQAILSLRLKNTAHQDEALYVWAGHLVLDHLRNGTSLDRFGFAEYFSGAPQLYPVAAAVLDDLGGLALVRIGSLACMLGTTALLYSISRRMFNERVGLCAAALFATLQSTQFLGNFATYDGPALFLLAIAAWIVVYAGRSGMWLALTAVPVLALATGVKYASALYIPTIAVLGGLVAARTHGAKWGVVRTGAIGLGSAALSYLVLVATGVLAALQQTTTERDHGTDGFGYLAMNSLEWSGVVLVMGITGSILYVRKAGMGEVPVGVANPVPGRGWRILLVTTLVGTAFLAPAYQIHLQTNTSLAKHVGYGLLFTSVIAGVGVTRLMGNHFRYLQFGIAVVSVSLVLGMAQANVRFHGWPDSGVMVAELRKHVSKDGGPYLVQGFEIPSYYLRDVTTPGTFRGESFLDYTTEKGEYLEGPDAYEAAIADGHFEVIVLSAGTADESPNIRAIRSALVYGGRYRMERMIPFQLFSGVGAYELWTRDPAS